MISCNRIRADRPSLALLAELAEIQVADSVHQFAKMIGIVGQHASFKVALVFTFL
jgi:hypothetical protein